VGRGGHGEGGLEGGGVSDVSDDVFGVAGGDGVEFVGGGPGLVGLAAKDGHLGAGGDEPAGDAEVDAAGAAGDEGVLVFQDGRGDGALHGSGMPRRGTNKKATRVGGLFDEA
jgi:hypothetical protein